MSDQVTTNVIATHLGWKLGKDLPFDVHQLAAEIAADLDVAAVRHMRDREEALQRALVATMDYLSGVNRSLGDQIERLRSENRELHIRLARATMEAGTNRIAQGASVAAGAPAA